MAVNVFLSSRTWALPRNIYGVRHHVLALYQEVFQGSDLRVYPKGRESGLLADGVRHLPVLLEGDINILAPGYPIVSGALASWVKRDPGLVVHTWKVPGVSDGRLSARGYDLLLRRVIDRARAVVVASHTQRRQIEAFGVGCPVVFAPVTIDSEFWHPEPDQIDTDLAKFGLKRESYVLTVGGNDRDEHYGARLSRELGISYVRATNSVEYAQRIEAELSRSGLNDHATLLVHPADTELRALYAGARIVCLPTVARTNPAGTSALVEALACGALVGVPASIAEGYVLDGANGLELCDMPERFASRMNLNSAHILSIRLAARTFAEEQLNVLRVGTHLRPKLL